jgi:hypothetical protein
MPLAGKQVGYEGHEYEVVTASEQQSSDNEGTLADPEMCALVRVTRIEAGSGRS